MAQSEHAKALASDVLVHCIAWELRMVESLRLNLFFNYRTIKVMEE